MENQDKDQRNRAAEKRSFDFDRDELESGSLNASPSIVSKLHQEKEITTKLSNLYSVNNILNTPSKQSNAEQKFFTGICSRSYGETIKSEEKEISEDKNNKICLRCNKIDLYTVGREHLEDNACSSIDDNIVEGRISFKKLYQDIEYKASPDPNTGDLIPDPFTIVGLSDMIEQSLAFGTIPVVNITNSTLAVAVAVSPDEGYDFIPEAIKYDMDSKPPIYKNRRFRFYVIAAAILLFAVGVGTTFCTTLLKRYSMHRNKYSLFSPTKSQKVKSIADQLKRVVGKTRFAIKDSPYARAAEWIYDDDPLQLLQGSENLIQRYLLVLFYFSTTKNRPWKSCNPSVGIETEACNFTKLVRTFPEVYELVPWYRWLSGRHECDWAGVICDEFNQTRALELSGQQIFGTFPTDIAKMPYLQSLTFNLNEFYGTLPSELSQMKHLLNIELHYNLFTGRVPSEWYKAQALQRINFAGNFLTGTIPTEIGLLSSMKGYFMQENGLAGSLPTEIGKMTFLTFSRWGRNFLTGTLPTEFGSLGKVQEVWIHRNKLHGTLPREMVSMKELGDLRLQYNALSGTIPEEHYNMSQLRRWDLYDCNFTGTISTNIRNLVNLQTYRIRGNNFHGTIPKEMGELSNLATAWLQENNLTGMIPLEICTKRGPLGITTLQVDCDATNGIHEPLVECIPSCCTSCCDSVTGYCVRG